MKDIVLMLILGTATPGGGFPLYGDAFAEMVGSWSYVLAKPDLPEQTAYLLARAIHRAEAPFASRLEQARETTMANTVKAAPRTDLSILGSINI